MMARRKNSRKREARKLMSLHEGGQLVATLDELEADADLREGRGDHAGALAIRYALARIRGEDVDAVDEDEPVVDTTGDVAPAQDWPEAAATVNDDGEALY